MSKTEKHEPAAPVAAAAAEPKASGGLIRLAGITGGIFVVVTAECLAAYFLLPSASDLAAAAEARLIEKARQVAPAEETDPEEDEEAPTIEVELGVFNIGTHVPATSTTLRIDFKLAGVVAAADRAQFEELVAKHQNRVRDRIIFEVRSAGSSDLSDPGLGLLKRRILEKVNASLGKPILRGVIVSEFSFVGT